LAKEFTRSTTPVHRRTGASRAGRLPSAGAAM